MATYIPYTFAEMARDTKHAEYVNRIKYLLDNNLITVRAAKERTFAAYGWASKYALTYKAVLQVRVYRSSVYDYVLEDSRKPADFIKAIADFLTIDAKRYGKLCKA